MIFEIILIVSLIVHLLMLVVGVWRVLKGENAVDRLIGFDLIGIITIAILILLSFIESSRFYINVAAGLAFFGFVVTIILAKFIAQQKQG
ncbi:hypothetical protein BVX98_06935 [bacterium F11]|nr:hypothetical protein BVX98_06935 [bacterium F11]